ncbi:MAG: hypothetical protein II702_04165, partial [Clostridia bacterium]|nr:hypothetical protein [Clostridia bacterium]
PAETEAETTIVTEQTVAVISESTELQTTAAITEPTTPTALQTVLTKTETQLTTEMTTAMATSTTTTTKPTTIATTTKHITTTITNTLTNQTSVTKTKQLYVLNINNERRRIHKPDCRDVPNIKKENYSEYYGTIDELEALGYTPCGHCNP